MCYFNLQSKLNFYLAHDFSVPPSLLGQASCLTTAANRWVWQTRAVAISLWSLSSSSWCSHNFDGRKASGKEIYKHTNWIFIFQITNKVRKSAVILERYFDTGEMKCTLAILVNYVTKIYIYVYILYSYYSIILHNSHMHYILYNLCIHYIQGLSGKCLAIVNVTRMICVTLI